MARSGTNNGGGPRWGTMPRETCPRCGLTRPVGIHQGENAWLCNNTEKCHKRMERREKKAKQTNGGHDH